MGAYHLSVTWGRLRMRSGRLRSWRVVYPQYNTAFMLHHEWVTMSRAGRVQSACNTSAHS